jgi:anti-anti-sigma factor
MDCDVELDGKILVASLRGRLAQGSYGACFKRIQDEAEAGGARAIILELSGVEYISSAGLAGIIRLQHEWQGAGRTFSLAGASPLAARLFESVELARVVSIHDIEEEARKNAGGGARA